MKALFLFIFFPFFLFSSPIKQPWLHTQEKVLSEVSTANTDVLWDVFLEGQAALFFNDQISWLERIEQWDRAGRVLDLGCGNGEFLKHLIKKNQNKTFMGVDLSDSLLAQAKLRSNFPFLSFKKGHVQSYLPFCSAFSPDVIIFRLTLQHLDQPQQALDHAGSYLKPGGVIFVLDSFDSLHKISTPIPELDRALKNVQEIQKERSKGDRLVSIKLQKKYANGGEFEIVDSNLDENLSPLFPPVSLADLSRRRLYFRHLVLFSELLKRTYKMDVDNEKVYEGAFKVLHDEKAWVMPAFHYLALVKLEQKR
jgi:SAM-dependent methyltransferase